MALGSVDALGVQESGVEGRLAESQEGLEDVDLRLGQAGLGDLLGDRQAVVVAQLAVALLLGALQVAVERLLGFGRQFGEHLALGASEDEGGQRPAEQGQAFALGREVLGDPLEDRRAAEHARIEKLEEAPELAEVVFHGRAGHGQAMVGPQQAAGLGRCDWAFLIAWASSRMA